MYIKKDEIKYLENLFNTLDEAQKKKFMDLLREAASVKSGKDVERMKIIDDEDIRREMIDESEIVTKTMVKKAYKATKEEKK